MRITRTTTSTARPTGTGVKDQGRTKTTRVEGVEGLEAKKTSFIEELRESSDPKTKEILDEVLGKIDGAARLFLEHPILDNLLTYKDLVRRFMKLVTEKLYRVKERLSSRATDRQKIYTILEEVDKRLNLLTEEFLAGQNDSLSLVAKMDEIRGMLVDLYS